MNKYPIIEILVFFSRFGAAPTWENPKHLKRIRSCYSKVDGGIRKSYYTIETKEGSLYNLVFNEEELIWEIDLEGYIIDKILVEVKRHKHLASRAHRLIPYRFELKPKGAEQKTAPALIERVQPFRWKRRKAGSFQVIKVETRHLENIMVDKHLHYVVETDDCRFFHIALVLSEMDWRLINEIDESTLFVRS